MYDCMIYTAVAIAMENGPGLQMYFLLKWGYSSATLFYQRVVHQRSVFNILSPILQEWHYIFCVCFSFEITGVVKEGNMEVDLLKIFYVA